MRKVFRCILALSALGALAYADGPVKAPPDVKKSGVTTGPFLPEDNSCWQASAANMLAAAGYGNGKTSADRAGEIYQQLVDHFGLSKSGWVDTAVKWWLSSEHNRWPENPLKSCRFLGPDLRGYHDPDLLVLLDGELNKGNLVSLGVFRDVKGVGHELTLWGVQRPQRQGRSSLSRRDVSTRPAGEGTAGGDPEREAAHAELPTRTATLISVSDSDRDERLSAYEISWDAGRRRWKIAFRQHEWFIGCACILGRQNTENAKSDSPAGPGSTGK